MIEKKDFKKLSPFKGWVLENFPFIEADFDAITEYQLYCKIVEYLNKVIYNQKLLEDSDNELVDAFNELKNYVDTYIISIPDFKQAIDLINERLNELALQVDNNTSNISLLNGKIDSEIETLDSKLSTLIEQNFNVLKNYVDDNVRFLNNKIDNLNITDLRVYDPTTGLFSPLQLVLTNIAQLSNKDGLTASEFDNLDLTVTAFESYQITAYEFDSSGKIILV
jgi:hypothetical protein